MERRVEVWQLHPREVDVGDGRHGPRETDEEGEAEEAERQADQVLHEALLAHGGSADVHHHDQDQK